MKAINEHSSFELELRNVNDTAFTFCLFAPKVNQALPLGATPFYYTYEQMQQHVLKAARLVNFIHLQVMDFYNTQLPEKESKAHQVITNLIITNAGYSPGKIFRLPIHCIHWRRPVHLRGNILGMQMPGNENLLLDAASGIEVPVPAKTALRLTFYF